MAAHRYWRFLCTAVNAGAYVALTEIELFDSTYADVTASTMVINHSSVYQAGYEGPKAFDNLSSSTDYTIWISSGATTPSVSTPEWVSIDLGSGNAKDIIAFSLKNRTDGNSYDSDQAPKDFKIQWSDDGSSWTDLFSVTAQTGWATLGERRWYNASGTAQMVPPPPPSEAVGTVSKRFWRLRASAVDGDPNALSINELEFHTTVGGTQQATGGSAHSGTFHSGTAADAFDGAVGATWISGTRHDWVGYLFAAAIEIVEVSVTARSSFAGQSPKDFVIEYLDGSGVFQTAHSVTGQVGWANSEVRTFTWGTATARRPVVFTAT